ncbi:programmed cell death protein [Nowakowskiella sp. JEL0407]|nr:programmed cell death protein [Nowakowskiella sp. JEL0407]
MSPLPQTALAPAATLRPRPPVWCCLPSCPVCLCLQQHSLLQLLILVFRSQLQDINPFYPSSTDLSANPDLSSAPKIDPSAAKLCIVCGLAGTKQCGKCHSARYCSKDHQILHWPSHKRICSPQQSSDQPFKSKPLFPEYEIVSEDEPETHVDEAQDDPIVNQEKIDQTLKEFNREEKLKKEIEEQFKDVVLEQEEAEDSDAYVDKAFLKFQKRVERSPEQILRYARVNEDPQDAIPLWASDLNKPNPISGESQTIPSCPNCGTDRAFEFQIMPHVLSLLEIDHINPNSMDWGTLLVYTCPKNCVKDGDCGTYMEEVVWKQDFSIDGIGNQIRGIEEKKA